MGVPLGRAQIDYFVSEVTLLGKGQYVALDVPEFVKFAISARRAVPLPAKGRKLPFQSIEVPKIEPNDMLIILARPKMHN